MNKIDILLKSMFKQNFILLHSTLTDVFYRFQMSFSIIPNSLPNFVIDGEVQKKVTLSEY